MSGRAPLPVAVVDYGAGNLVSIEQALTHVGAQPFRARHSADLEHAAALIVPGVGAAGPAMVRLRRAGLVQPIRDWIAADRPFIGICLGLQLLFDSSEEDGARTLGILPGVSRRLIDAPTLPHIGWNQVRRRRRHPLFDGLADDVDLYFVHSYAGAPTNADDELVLAETEHGRPFVSAVARANLLGVQFHPERSGVDGLRVLSNFVRLAAQAGQRAA